MKRNDASGAYLAGMRWFAAEFLVVLVGILAALGVDSWLSANRDRHEEAFVLAALDEEVGRNLTLLDLSARRQAQLRQNIQAVLSLAGVSPVPASRDSAIDLIRNATRWEMFNPQTGVLSATLSSGDLSLIRDRELRAALASLGSVFDDLAEGERFVVDGRRELLRHMATLGTPTLASLYPDFDRMDWQLDGIFTDATIMELFAMQDRALIEPLERDYPRVRQVLKELSARIAANR